MTNYFPELHISISIIYNFFFFVTSITPFPSLTSMFIKKSMVKRNT